MRLNEHAFRTWDIEVAVDAAATIPPQVAAPVVDNLALDSPLHRQTERRHHDHHRRHHRAPTRLHRRSHPRLGDIHPYYALEAAAELELTAEAFGRLVYGRLDPQHTPHDDEGLVLDVLRPVFPGP